MKRILKDIRYFQTNVYHTTFKENVLICYTTHPFRHQPSISHTSLAEARIIAELFSQMNYNVDIIDHNSTWQPNYKKYEVVFGFGDPFEESFYQGKKDQIRIFYATGAHPCFKI